MLFDGVVKVLKSSAAVQMTVQLGYPEWVVFPLGMVVLVCIAFYVIRNSMLGAILMTGYLGGATATKLRVGSPLYFFPIVVGVLAWAGLYLRDKQLRALIPLRSL